MKTNILTIESLGIRKKITYYLIITNVRKISQISQYLTLIINNEDKINNSEPKLFKSKKANIVKKSQ